MSEPEIVVCGDATELYQRAANQFVALANEACRTTGQFTVALSGGSTPRGLYSLLSMPQYRRQVLWSKVHFFWGDERCVAPDHPDSNYRMVEESLLASVDVDSENIHRMAGEKEPQTAARDYEERLKKSFSLSDGQFPRFDLVLLGLGEDGHTASLFAGVDALDESKRMVVAVEFPLASRITLTFPVFNGAANVVFLVAGQSKAAIVRDLLGGKSHAADLPAARVKLQNGRLVWLVTKDAAVELHDFS